MCELLYAGKTRAEIAGYDDAFMRWVLCRPRDEHGRLVRRDPDLPRWVTENLDSSGHWRIRNPTSFHSMFRQVKEHQGMDEAARRAAWQEWRQANPRYGGSDEEYDGCPI